MLAVDEEVPVREAPARYAPQFGPDWIDPDDRIGPQQQRIIIVVPRHSKFQRQRQSILNQDP